MKKVLFLSVLISFPFIGMTSCEKEEIEPLKKHVPVKSELVNEEDMPEFLNEQVEAYNLH